MNSIQFIGLPEVTPLALIKYGFNFNKYNQQQWYVVVVMRKSGVEVIHPVKDVSQAMKYAQELKDLYQGGEKC